MENSWSDQLVGEMVNLDENRHSFAQQSSFDMVRPICLESFVAQGRDFFQLKSLGVFDFEIGVIDGCSKPPQLR